MIEELNYLDYYSSGYILDRLSYSPKESISVKLKTKYENKEEVKMPNRRQIYFFFFIVREVVVYEDVVNKNDKKI